VPEDATQLRLSSFRGRLLIALVLGALALALPNTAAAAEGASISGNVTVASTGQPIAEVTVCALKVGGGGIRCVDTDSAGDYTISNLEAGSWDVQFGTERVGMGLLNTSYERDPVVLGASTQAEGIDVALSAGGKIGGVVTAAQTGEPLAEILVCLVPSPMQGSPHCTETGEDGSYAFEDLASGSYEVAFSPEGEEIWGPLLAGVEAEIMEALYPPDGYATLWWQSGGSLSAATPIVLTAPQTVSGIDGAIGSPEYWTLVSQRVVIPPPIPPAPVVSEPNSPLTTPTATKPVIATKKPKELDCKRGFVKRKAHGKERCVKRHKIVRHAKKKHRKHAA
jgi:Carboxypeptidase regulatory-like domain